MSGQLRALESLPGVHRTDNLRDVTDSAYGPALVLALFAVDYRCVADVHCR